MALLTRYAAAAAAVLLVRCTGIAAIDACADDAAFTDYADAEACKMVELAQTIPGRLGCTIAVTTRVLHDRSTEDCGGLEPQPANGMVWQPPATGSKGRCWVAYGMTGTTWASNKWSCKWAETQTSTGKIPPKACHKKTIYSF